MCLYETLLCIKALSEFRVYAKQRKNSPEKLNNVIILYYYCNFEFLKFQKFKMCLHVNIPNQE